MGAGRRRVAALTVVLLWGAAGCADSHFKPDAEDARRLGLLQGDPLAVSLGTCTDSTAHYRPSSGEPLDFAAVESSVIRCDRSPAAATDVLAVLTTAESAGWTPSVEGGRGGRFVMRKRFGDVWAKATFAVNPGILGAELSIPPHSRTGEPPGPAETAQGRTCFDAVKAGQPPPPVCPPQVP